MNVIKQPKTIIFGDNSGKEFVFPKNSVVISSKGYKSRKWHKYLELDSDHLFDKVESDPSIETAQKIISELNRIDFRYVVGVGGGSSLDVAKFVAFKMNKKKIMIPTTFGSGSELTKISVLKVDGKKQSFHHEKIFADIAIIDPHFIKDTPQKILKNSAIDACAQCSEGYDSKLGNKYTRFLCLKAFELLEDGLLNKNNEKLVLGSIYAGLGFGNSSTTLGHALSYVFSNEGISHGHALAFTTTVAHNFNGSIFYKRFKKIVKKLEFKKIELKMNYSDASELILKDRKHLDNNPRHINKKNIEMLLKIINDGDTFNDKINYKKFDD